MAKGCSYRIVDSRTENFTEHTHNFCEIFIMLSGNAYHTANGKRRKLRERDVIFIRPDDVHKYSETSGEVFSFLNLTFTRETLGEVFSYLGEGFPSESLMSAEAPPAARLTRGEVESLRSRMQIMGAIAPGDGAAERTAIRILIMELFINHFSDFTSHKERMPEWLDDLCVKMRGGGNFTEGAARMTELSGKSREHLSRSMKKHLGVSVTEFVNELRLNYIANMLTNSNKKIAEIIFESGFNTISRATSLFKARYGVTMREFRVCGG